MNWIKKCIFIIVSPWQWIIKFIKKKKEREKKRKFIAVVIVSAIAIEREEEEKKVIMSIDWKISYYLNKRENTAYFENILF